MSLIRTHGDLARACKDIAPSQLPNAFIYLVAN